MRSPRLACIEQPEPESSRFLHCPETIVILPWQSEHSKRPVKRYGEPAGIGGISQVLKLNDPYVGEAIRHEAGIRYVVLSYLAVGSSVILLVVGTLQGWARRKRSR